MNQASKHKVFISYYHQDDQEYKNRLVNALDSKFVDKSVSQGDIHDEGLHLDEIRRRIRDDHIADATVTVVLIGPCTWQRNIGGDDSFAVIYDWPKNGLSKKVLLKIHTAFLRRNRAPWPDDGLDLFADNRTGACLRGWQG